MFIFDDIIYSMPACALLWFIKFQALNQRWLQVRLAIEYFAWKFSTPENINSKDAKNKIHSVIF